MSVAPVQGIVSTKPTTGLAPLTGAAGSVAAVQDRMALTEAFAKAAKLNALPIGTAGAAGTGAEQVLGGAARAADLATSEYAQEQDSLASLLTPAGLLGGPAPVAAPPPPTSFVDPSAFADLLTNLWLREQGKTTREVRVSFGNSAWPATGARLVRLEDGSLQVAVLVGDRGAGDQSASDALKERLQARGLTVSDISFQRE